MPTYEYVCLSCGTHVEVYQRFSDEPLTECGVCGGKLRKVFHPAGILFKGSGFYATDSRSHRQAAEAGASKGSQSGAGSSWDGGSKSDAGSKSEGGTSGVGSKSEGGTSGVGSKSEGDRSGVGSIAGGGSRSKRGSSSSGSKERSA